MIVSDGKYYLYRHVRLDTNDVFYVGIGTKSNNDYLKGTFGRAETYSGHNQFWNSVVAKTKYYVDILIQSDSREFIEQKEIEFISIYGRRDKNVGTLTNLNDGGRGDNSSDFSIKNAQQTKKITGSYYKNVERMRMYAELHRQNGTYCYKKTYTYDKEGFFLKEYKNRIDCVKDLNSNSPILNMALRNKESCNGVFVTNFRAYNIDVSLYRMKTYKRAVVSLNSETFELVKVYQSAVDAIKEVGSCKANIGHSIRLLKKCKGFYWAYEHNYDETIQALINKKNAPCPEYRRIKARETFAKYDKENPGSRSHEKTIINIETGEVFKGVSCILESVGLSRSLMTRRLNGEIINNTPYRYVDDKYSKVKMTA